MTPRPSRRRARLAGAILATLALTACTGNEAVRQQPDDRIQGGDAATFRVSVGDRSPVTEVTGELLDGTAFDLADWRGDVVVINFWGSWCAPCRSEAPVLGEVSRDFRQRGVRFLGIDVRDDRAAAAAFARSHRLDYPSIFDPSNLLALRFRGVPPTATPTTVVLDREGRVAVRHSGEIRYNVLRAAVQSVLAEPA